MFKINHHIPFMTDELPFGAQGPKRGVYLKKSRPVSRILYPRFGTLIIYLGAKLPGRSIFLPSGNERETLKCRYT